MPGARGGSIHRDAAEPYCPCPFTTLCWDFLARHRQRFSGHPRMGLQVRNLERKLESGSGEVAEIRRRAQALRERPDEL